MSDKITKSASEAVLRHAANREELEACFPVISLLRPKLAAAAEWIGRAEAMSAAGYRVLAAWNGDRVAALAGYRINENLIYGRFLYVDDLVTADDRRGKGLGAALLDELTIIAKQKQCQCLVLDTAAANTNARRFYKREGLLDLVVGFVKPLEQVA